MLSDEISCTAVNSSMELEQLSSRMRIDPALASGAFVTTVTDVVGFFAFLTLAGVLLL